MRIRLKIGIGDGGNAEMLRAIRVHANFAEYVPFSLLLIYMLEVNGGAVWLIHVLGCTLLFARLLHAFGVSQLAEKMLFRQIGMVLTFSTIAVAALSLLAAAFKL